MFPSSKRLSAVLSSLLILSSDVAYGVKRYEIVNNCPLSANLYINHDAQGTLAANGGTVTREYSDEWDGYIFTDLNRGNARDRAGTIRAGFLNRFDFYWISYDQKWRNVGVSIQPVDAVQADGFCRPLECLVDACPQGAPYEPQRFPLPYDPTNGPPPTPIYGCPATTYRVTFCPDGEIPHLQQGPNNIHPESSMEKCLDVRADLFENGTPVQINNCDDSPGQKWDIKRGGQQIRLYGTNFCLDAGSSSPEEGAQVTIQQCSEGSPSQQWDYGTDDRISLPSSGKRISTLLGK
ncbi:hypothetical protein CC1G_05246 [Coprinopsis cinerea okayama7|uniref:Ricin B lectin domain-containing protein n=1 Tax=Coprinopsis cinerea (strain Okayama-7 / 130 / ATCC MYA-4618 / FGSC 9003) TaxID=240176 RepID=A8PCC0_COPC7|nr:hypothetical protein CC1G_05246 [Coprinopsis cinerea okayama7\|eukprot:XP_001840360.1 hypothetical protein CC1G_05246 [Coprinopsis cinerea okayama7\